MIKISNLVKEFNINGKFRAVDDVSLEVNQGEVYGIIGLSGAGKSTLVRCINRLEEFDQGSIEIEGVRVDKLNSKELLNLRKNIGMIFQHFNLFSQMTVSENIAYPLKLAKHSKAEIEQKVDEMLDFVELKDKKDSYPSSLSGGQKQRVAIARALANNPKILLSDESTSALDPTTTQEILKLIRKLVDNYGTTVIMITHQMEVAKSICDRIAVMQDGKIVEENYTKELFRHPKSEITRSFIQDISIDDELDIIKSSAKGRLFRLTYDDKSYNSPIISELSKIFDIDINILSGNVNKLSNTNVGYLIVEFIGEDRKIDKAVNYCKEKDIFMEVLNV